MKNYTVRFALSMTMIILPILIIIYGIILFVHTLKQEWSMSVFGKELLILGLSLILVFFISLGIGYYLYKKTNYEIKEEATTISNGIVLARKRDIYKIKARRFIFLYSFDVYCKPWQIFAFISYYFHSRNELIEFVNKNSSLKEYIREKDLIKLGIKNI